KMRMNIRLKIMDQTDHPFEVDDQGHVLKNENSTLSACGLRDGHVVHLVERPANVLLEDFLSLWVEWASHPKCISLLLDRM
ncbi:hypothetical protein TELCIR_13597, partial [Teladorsagia circumcincta]